MLRNESRLLGLRLSYLLVRRGLAGAVPLLAESTFFLQLRHIFLVSLGTVCLYEWARPYRIRDGGHSHIGTGTVPVLYIISSSGIHLGLASFTD